LCGKGEDEKKDGEEFRKYLMKNAILPHAFWHENSQKYRGNLRHQNKGEGNSQNSKK
jgi:hypothetical protein